jgi:uncharacterized membrane protein
MTSPRALSSLKSLAALLCTWLAASAAWGASAYTVAPLNVPGSASTTLGGINDSGTIVGSFTNVIDGTAFTSFVYRDGVFSNLDGPSGAISSVVRGISNSGVIVGVFATEGVALTRRSFLFDGTSYTELMLPFGEGAARSISPNGRYVAGDVFGNNAGFVYDLVTGQAQTFGAESFVTVTQGVNDHGQVVGSRSARGPDGLLQTRPFLFDANSGVFIENPESYAGLTEARPRAINNNGVVGGFSFGGGAFIREGEQITSLTFESVSFATIYGINSDGLAVGYTTTGVGPGSFSQGFIATPVPEPASLVLLLIGGIGLMALRRSRAGLSA